jgi:hypothetical protein
MTAFRATFADMKLVKTRQVAQLIFEVPIEDFDAAYEVLGGMPVPSKERWFGIAAILPEKEAVAKREKMDWRELPPATQAGIRCEDPVFIAFLKDQYAAYWINYESAASTVRDICEVKSRSEFSTDHRKRVLWHQLDSQFSAWLAKERVGA